MSGEESPFLKDYTDKVDEMIRDMAHVTAEVTGFLEARYGNKYNTRNLIGFLWVFTAVFLLKDEIDIDDYLNGLELLYEYLKQKYLECQK
jgi:hypothetical protein